MTHIDGDKRFKSDKYPSTPAGKVPLSTSDPDAQDLLFTYASRHVARDSEFARDLFWVLREDGYTGGAIRSNFEDVGDFHEKFDLPRVGTVPPASLSKDHLAFRGNFLIEELAEFFEASGATVIARDLREIGNDVREEKFLLYDVPTKDLAKAGDALVDLCYVALGTAHFMGLPYDAMWDEVQRANMEKERATGADDERSKRGHGCDVVKPAGWKGPEHEPLIQKAMDDLHKKTERGVHA